jgi:hypothetical protein
LIEAQNCLTNCGLSATRFTHQAHGFTALDRKADAVHCLHVSHHALHQTGFDREILLEILHLKDIIGALSACFVLFFDHS